MPTVPYSPVPDVAAQDVTTPLLRVNTPPAAFGVNVADSVRRMGSTLGEVGNELFNRAVAMQELRNQAEATQGVSDYMQRGGDKFVQYESLRGQNAVAAEPAHRADQENLRLEVRDGLSNDRVRKDFDRAALSIQRQYTISGARHAASENRVSVANSIQSEIQAGIDTAGYSKSPEEFDQSLRNIDISSRQHADFMGLDPASGAQLSFKNQSAARAERIMSLNRTNPVAAKQEMEDAISKGQLHWQDRDRVEGRVHGALLTQSSRYFTDANDQDFQNPESFLARRAVGKGVHTTGVDGQFGQNLVAAITAAERATGETAKIKSISRTYQEQKDIRAEHEAMPGGVAAHPAALPGTSRHEFGQAADLQSGKVLDWLHQNASRFGLEFLPGKTGVNDPGHIQLAGDAPLRRVRMQDIDEKTYVESAKAKLLNTIPTATPDLIDRVMSDARGRYNQNVAYDRQRDTASYNTVLEQLQRDDPPRTLSDLLGTSPEVSNAYYDLPAKQQESLRRIVEKNPQTDIAEYQKQMGMFSAADQRFTSDENLDFIRESGKFSKRTQAELINKVMTARRKFEADANVSVAWTALHGMGIIPQDILKDKDLSNTLRGALYNQINIYKQALGKAPTGEDLKQIGRNLLATQVPNVETQPLGSGFGDRGAVIPKWGSIWAYYTGTSTPFYETPVPAKAAEEIKKQVQQEKGIIPTDSDIQQLWLMDQYQKLYGKPKKTQ